jgi:hypothetical protein
LRLTLAAAIVALVAAPLMGILFAGVRRLIDARRPMAAADKT